MSLHALRHSCLMLLATMVLPATAQQTLADALSNGETKFSLRYRYEYVDQDGFNENADASTVRARLSYGSGQYKDTTLFLEFDVIEEVGADDFNSGAGSSGPERARFPVVADPDGSEVNQAWLQYSGIEKTKIKFGRQRINLDNQRFVGGVGWRQNEQTYDGISITNTTLNNTQLFYAYISNVNRIFGGDVAAGDHESETHLLNVGHKFSDSLNLAAYYYAIDNEDALAFSTDTLGVRLSGNTKLSDYDFSYNLEVAHQEDGSNNPVNYNQTYYRLDGKLSLDLVNLNAGYEVLGGDANSPGSAFRTPLATLHAFNGWADKFLATPNAGLEDLFIGLSGKIAEDWRWQAVYHDFQAEDSSQDYGDEFDLSLARNFGKNYGVLLKFADFSSDNPSPAFADTTKIWLMLSANF